MVCGVRVTRYTHIALLLVEADNEPPTHDDTKEGSVKSEPPSDTGVEVAEETVVPVTTKSDNVPVITESENDEVKKKPEVSEVTAEKEESGKRVSCDVLCVSFGP